MPSPRPTHIAIRETQLVTRLVSDTQKGRRITGEYYSTVLRWVMYIVIATHGYWIVKFAITSLPAKMRRSVLAYTILSTVP